MTTVTIARVETPEGRRWSLWDGRKEVVGLKSWTKADLIADCIHSWPGEVTYRTARGILTKSEWALVVANAQGVYLPYRSYVLALDVLSRST